MKVSMHGQLRPPEPCWIMMVFENIAIGIGGDLAMSSEICLQSLLAGSGHPGAEKALRYVPYFRDKILTFEAPAKSSPDHRFCGMGIPGYTCPTPKVLANLSSITNFEIKPHIRTAFLPLTRVESDIKIFSASRRRFCTPSL